MNPAHNVELIEAATPYLLVTAMKKDMEEKGDNKCLHFSTGVNPVDKRLYAILIYENKTNPTSNV